MRPCPGRGVFRSRGEADTALPARRVRLQLVEGLVLSALETFTTKPSHNFCLLIVGIVGFPRPVAFSIVVILLKAVLEQPQISLKNFQKARPSSMLSGRRPAFHAG